MAILRFLRSRDRLLKVVDGESPLDPFNNDTKKPCQGNLLGSAQKTLTILQNFVFCDVIMVAETCS